MFLTVQSFRLLEGAFNERPELCQSYSGQHSEEPENQTLKLFELQGSKSEDPNLRIEAGKSVRLDVYCEYQKTCEESKPQIPTNSEGSNPLRKPQ